MTTGYHNYLRSFSFASLDFSKFAFDTLNINRSWLSKELDPLVLRHRITPALPL